MRTAFLIASLVLAHAKGIDVSQLDPALPPQRLEQWLAAHTDGVRWRVSDCGLKNVLSTPEAEWPLCVQFIFQRGQVSGVGTLTVGKGGMIAGPPVLEHIFATTRAAAKEGRHASARRLSELPRMLAELSASPSPRRPRS